MYLLGMRFENGLVWHNNGLSCLLCFVLVMSNRLQSSPENDPNDPLMSGTGNRPTRQYGQKVQQEMSHINFMQRTHPPIVSNHQDRLAWDHLGWTPLDHVIFFAFEKNLGQYMAPYPPPEPAVYPRLNAVSRLLGKSLGQLARPLAKSSDQYKSTNPTPDPVVPARLLALTRLLIEHGADTDGIDL